MAYTWTEFVLRVETTGVRGVVRSVDAMKAATTNMTVVKKPKVFWSRTKLEYIVGVVWRVARSLFLEVFGGRRYSGDGRNWDQYSRETTGRECLRLHIGWRRYGNRTGAIVVGVR